MIMLEIVAVLLGSVLMSMIFGFTYLGVSYFFESLDKYEREAKYFIDEK